MGLQELRKSLDLSQTTMADEMGLSLRAYQEIENGRSPFRKLHVLAAERIALAHAARASHPGALPASVLSDIIVVARSIKAASRAGAS